MDIRFIPKDISDASYFELTRIEDEIQSQQEQIDRRREEFYTGIIEKFNLKPTDNTRTTSNRRIFLMAHAKENTRFSLERIAKMFDRTHMIVLRAVQKNEDKLGFDREVYLEDIAALKEYLYQKIYE